MALVSRSVIYQAVSRSENRRVSGSGAANERLARLRSDDLARLAAIGHKTAKQDEPSKRLDHDALLYDERGLPA